MVTAFFAHFLNFESFEMGSGVGTYKIIMQYTDLNASERKENKN